MQDHIDAHTTSLRAMSEEAIVVETLNEVAPLLLSSAR